MKPDQYSGIQIEPQWGQGLTTMGSAQWGQGLFFAFFTIRLTVDTDNPSAFAISLNRG